MEIFINGSQIAATNLSVETDVLDETLDTFSFYIVNDDPTPIPPMSNVEVREDGQSSYFVLSADSVEPFTLIKGEYKHSITCVENVRKLSKYVIRNTVFTQPKNQYRTFSSNFAWSENTLVINLDDQTANHYSHRTMEEIISDGYVSPLPRISLASREKCKRTFIEVALQVASANQGDYTLTYNAVSHNDLKTVQEIKDLFPDQFQGGDLFALNPILHYTLNGQQTQTIVITEFNKEIEYPEITELLNQGATDIYIDFGGSQMLQNTVQYPNRGSHMPFYSVQIKVRAEVYYYSVYDILRLIRLRCAKFMVLDGHFPLSQSVPFSLPTSGELYELLNNTIAPDFTFTQCTLYEAVAEVFRLFDAIFTMDGNGVLGITYFNKRKGQITPKTTMTTSALGEERFVNGLMSFYQDARTLERFPQAKENYAPSRSADVGIPAEGDHNFIVPHPIHAVTKAIVNATVKFGGVVEYDQYTGEPSITTTIKVSNYPLDITHNIVEKSIWSGYLDEDSTVSYDDPYAQRQNNTVYYAQGDNKIELAYTYSTAWGFTNYAFGIAMQSAAMRQVGLSSQFSGHFEIDTPSSQYPSWKDVRMRVEYLTTVNGRLRVEGVSPKCEGEMMIDQTNGAVDLNKLGLNLLGLSYKMGEPNLGLSYKLSSWASRIRPGQTIVYDNAVWVANSCSYTCLGNGYYQGKVSFVKNYNELSLRKSILREKRMSNVSQALVCKSEEIIADYCYYSSSQDLPTEQPARFDRTVFSECMGVSFGVPSNLISTLDYSYMLASGDQTRYVYIPTIRYGAGNAVCFEMTFDDPISAGVKTASRSTGWFGAQEYVTSYVPYADEDGFMDIANIVVCYNASGDFSEDFPEVSGGAEAISMWSFDFYKQPNEVFALNYEVIFLPVDGNRDFIGSSFINDNFLVNGTARERAVRLFYSTTETYTPLDTKGKGDSTVVALSFDYGVIKASHTELPSTLSSWALCDENGNILFASNSSGYSNTEKRLYFALRNSRI